MKLITTLIFTMSFSILLAQQGTSNFIEWLDDENYVIAKRGEDKKLAYFKVNVEKGKEKAFEKEKQVTFTGLMPDGYSANGFNSHISPDKQNIVFSHEQDLYTFSKVDKKLHRITANPGEEKNARFSPDGQKVAFTRNHNLFVIDLQSGLEKQLTSDGSETIYNGWASWVYYEEILGRGSRYRAFYWSPDSRKIAFLRFDDSAVPTFPIYHHEGDDMTHGYLEMTHYPKAGDPNPSVKLGYAHVDHGGIYWVKQDESLEYLAMVKWTPDASGLTFQQMNRDQNLIRMYHLNIADKKIQQVYEEKQSTWVEWFERIDFLKQGAGFIIRSNRDGWYNLYHYDLQGKLVNQITQNDFRCSSILHIDESAGKIFYQATGENPVESHAFVVDFDGQNQQQLTQGAGSHQIELSPGQSYFVDAFTNFKTPLEQKLYDDSGKLIRPLRDASADANQQAGVKVEFFTIPTADGFELPAYWVLPPDFDESKKYPVLFRIYGGPDAGTVYNRYRDYSTSSLLNKGVILFTVDHRASGKFGKKGMDYMHRSLGKWEMNDYIEAVKWLRSKSFVDASRMGITGGSYGGYMSALALTYASDYFTHGIARFSVTDWRLYDNVYTERYMDEPKDNVEGYDFGSVMTHASRLKGKLYIIHGTIDDNVHLQNSMQLVSALQDKGKEFGMMLYPGGRHGWGGSKGMHVSRLTSQLWEEWFFGE